MPDVSSRDSIGRREEEEEVSAGVRRESREKSKCTGRRRGWRTEARTAGPTSYNRETSLSPLYFHRLKKKFPPANDQPTRWLIKHRVKSRIGKHSRNASRLPADFSRVLTNLCQCGRDASHINLCKNVRHIQRTRSTRCRPF